MAKGAEESSSETWGPVAAATLECFAMPPWKDLQQSGPECETSPVAGAAQYWVARPDGIPNEFGNDPQQAEAGCRKRAKRRGRLRARREDHQEDAKQIVDEPANGLQCGVAEQDRMRSGFQES